MVIIYLPAVALFWVPLSLRDVALTDWHILAGSLVSLHFLERVLESLFLHRYSGVMNLASVVMICGLYSSLSLLLGEVSATEVGGDGMPLTGFEVELRVGIGLWSVGVLLNLHHHRLLANLRKPGETGYEMPRGGLFRWIACPHYFAEIVGWWGYALVFHHVAAPIAASTMSLYLAGRSHNTVKWYRERMPDAVPTGWKRLIPFVY